jgi:predicted peroxiredoxin
MTTTALRAVKSMGLKLREIRHSQVAEIIEVTGTMTFTLLLPYFIIALSV